MHDMPKLYIARTTKCLKEVSQVLGSAVNPVLREGNSDRRVALPVKAHAMKHPKKLVHDIGWKILG